MILKKIFFYALVCIGIATNAAAQTFDGIGVFKLGMTIDDFNAWTQNQSISISEARDHSKLYEEKLLSQKVFLLLPKSK